MRHKRLTSYKRTTQAPAMVAFSLLLLSAGTSTEEAWGRKSYSSTEAKSEAGSLETEKVADQILSLVGLVPEDKEFETREIRKDLLFLLTRSGVSPDYVMDNTAREIFYLSDGSGLVPWCRDSLLSQKVSLSTVNRLNPMVSGVWGGKFFQLEGNQLKFLDLARRISKFDCKNDKSQKFLLLKTLRDRMPYGSDAKKALAIITFKAARECPSGIRLKGEPEASFNFAVFSLRSGSKFDEGTARAKLEDLKLLLSSGDKAGIPARSRRNIVEYMMPYLVRQKANGAVLEMASTVYDQVFTESIPPSTAVKVKFCYAAILQKAGKLKKAEKLYRESIDLMRKIDPVTAHKSGLFLSDEILNLYLANVLYLQGDDKGLIEVSKKIEKSVSKESREDSREIGVVSRALVRLALLRKKKYKEAAAIEVQDYPSTLNSLQGSWGTQVYPDVSELFPSREVALAADRTIYGKVGDKESLRLAEESLAKLKSPKDVYGRLKTDAKIPMEEPSPQNRETLYKAISEYRSTILSSSLSDQEKVEHLLPKAIKLSDWGLFTLSGAIFDDLIQISVGNKAVHPIYARRLLNEKAIVLLNKGDYAGAEKLVSRAKQVEVPEDDESIYATRFVEGKLALGRGEYEKAEELLAPLEMQWTENHSERQNYYRVQAMLSLAYSQYYQEKFEQSKLSLIKLSQRYLLLGAFYPKPGPEMSTLLALCLVASGHEPLGKYTLYDKFNYLHLSNPIDRASVLFNQGRFWELAGNKLRALRFYSSGINVLEDADYVVDDGLVKSPIGLKLASKIRSGSRSLKVDIPKYICVARERLESSPKGRRYQLEAENKSGQSR